MALSTKSKQNNVLTYSPIAEIDEGILSRAENGDGRTRAQKKGTGGVDRQRTMTDIKTVGLGSKQASLYISRTTSLVRTAGGDSRTGTADKDDCNSESSSKKTSVSSMQREFTFTGYDIMADSK